MLTLIFVITQYEEFKFLGLVDSLFSNGCIMLLMELFIYISIASLMGGV